MRHGRWNAGEPGHRPPRQTGRTRARRSAQEGTWCLELPRYSIRGDREGPPTRGKPNQKPYQARRRTQTFPLAGQATACHHSPHETVRGEHVHDTSVASAFLPAQRGDAESSRQRGLPNIDGRTPKPRTVAGLRYRMERWPPHPPRPPTPRLRWRLPKRPNGWRSPGPGTPGASVRRS